MTTTTLRLNKTTSIEIELTDGKLSISGTHDGGCGQCQDSIKEVFKDDKQVVRLTQIWDEYHLNDLTPGSPKQMAHLKTVNRPDGAEFHTWECKELERVNLYPDKSFIHNDKPYFYGSAWLTTSIPESIVKELQQLIHLLSVRYTKLDKGVSIHDKMAEDFLNDTKTELTIKFFKYDYHFEDDKDKRDVYDVTLKRGNREYCFKFGNSLADSGYFLNGKRQILPNSAGFVIQGKSGHISSRPLNRILPMKQVKNRPSEFIQHLVWGIQAGETITVKEPTPYTVLSCLGKYDVGTFEDFCNGCGYDTDSRRAEKTYKAVTTEYKAMQSLYNDSELEQLMEVQ